MEYVKVFLVQEMVLHVNIRCASCGRPFLFRGDAGFSTEQAMTNSGADTLYVPMMMPLPVPEEEEEKEPPVN